MRDKGKVRPSQGGCWYCHNKDNNLVFCREFDTFIHLECVREQVSNVLDKINPELEIIFRELWL